METERTSVKQSLEQVANLQELRSAHVNETTSTESVKKGDIVLIKELNSLRQLWKMEQVTEVFPGRDGKVRSCEVRTSGGTTLQRPVQILYHLESAGQASVPRKQES